jgi:hypothetical protein
MAVNATGRKLDPNTPALTTRQDSSVQSTATPTNPINLKHVLKMYEIAEEGLSGIMDRHLEEKIKKRDENTEKKSSGQVEKPISTHEANFRTWKDIKEVKDLRKRLHNYLSKYASETTKNIYSNQETEETTHAPITLQQAHDSMREFIMNGDVKSFCKKHKKMLGTYAKRLESEVRTLKKGKKNKA